MNPCRSAPAKATLFAIVVLAGPATLMGQQASGIDRVAWLQGCWEAASGENSIEETWMAPRGGSMLGMSRTVRAGSMTGYELVIIREDGERLAYRAHPSGQPSAVFLSAALSTDSAVFENPGHDYPKRIGYRRAGDTLLGWIEGARTGEDRREFPYRRVGCSE